MTTADLRLLNAKIPSRNGLEGGVAIEDGKIISISKNSQLPEADQTIDLEGSLLLPGIVDPHVHFRDPGFTDKETFSTGSKAAAAGGVTTICDMPNTSPPTDSLENFEEKRKIAESKSYVDFGLHGLLSESSEEGKRLWEAGVASLKLYPESYENFEIPDLKNEKAMITVHPENPQFLEEVTDDDVDTFIQARPKEAEISAIEKILSSVSEQMVHFCHVTTQESLELIGEEKKNRKITCEVSPHHLLLNLSHLRNLGAIVKTYPPVRSEDDRLVLLQGLKDGGIDMVATDHAPHTLEEKEKGLMEAPGGIAGIETSLPLLFTMVKKRKVSLSRLIEVMCSTPAQVFNLRSKNGVLKGTIQEGADADLVALNQDKKWTIKGEDLHGKTKFTPFEGREVIGKPFLTLVRGEMVYKEGGIVGKEGHGNFIPAGAQA